MRPVVLVGHKHSCPIHGEGVVVTGAANASSQEKRLACVGHMTSCGAVIVTGSSRFEIHGKGVARLGDVTSHGGVLIEGDESWQID